MATANELIDPLLNKRQKANQANQLPQTGLSPAQGVANVASGISDNVPGAGYGRFVGDQVKEAYTKGGVGAATGAAVRGAIGAPLAVVSDLGGMVDKGIASFGQLLDPAATALRTAVTGDATPIRQVMANDSSQASAPAQSNNTPTAPIVPAAVAAPMQPQTAPTASTAVMSTSQRMPTGIGDLAPGTGMIRNNRTGKVTTIDSSAPQQPLMQIARTEPQGIAAPVQIARSGDTSASKTMQENFMAEANRMLEKGTAGGVLGANYFLKKAEQASGIASRDSQSKTAEQNSGIAGFNALSQDADRRVGNEISRDALDEKKRGKALRDELMTLDDQSDPGGTKRASLKQKLQLLSGKEQDHYQPIMGRDDQGNPIAVGVFNKQTGKMLDPSGNPIRSQQDIAKEHNDALRAVQRGTISADEANRMLLANGFPALQK